MSEPVPSEITPVDMPCNVHDLHDEDCPFCMGTNRVPVPDEVRQVFDEFWRRLVVVNGQLDLGQVACELFDWYHAMNNVSTVYGEITGNRMSKPTYTADAVIGQFHEHLQRLREEWIEDAIECLDDLPRDVLDQVREAMS